jgi:hypothetical protein
LCLYLDAISIQSGVNDGSLATHVTVDSTSEISNVFG